MKSLQSSTITEIVFGLLIGGVGCCAVLYVMFLILDSGVHQHRGVVEKHLPEVLSTVWSPNRFYKAVVFRQKAYPQKQDSINVSILDANENVGDYHLGSILCQHADFAQVRWVGNEKLKIFHSAKPRNLKFLAIDHRSSDKRIFIDEVLLGD
jgi:hypothetical protein